MTSSFSDAVILECVGSKFKVQTTFRFHIVDKGSNLFLEVPAGFETDLASIGWYVGWLIPKIGKWNAASVVHDRAYAHPYLESIMPNEIKTSTRIDRLTADWLFLEAMTASGVKKWRRWLIFSGVRAGGWVVWNKRRAADDNNAVGNDGTG